MLLIALVLMAAQQPALEAAEKAAGKPLVQAPSKQMQALLQNCDAHKFETMIDIRGPDGSIKHSRMKLCGMEGQTDGEWIGTLKDAIAKTKANDKMPLPMRDQIVAAIGAEVARLQGKPAPATAALPPARATAKTSDVAEYTSLPPLPTAPPPPVHVLPGASAALPFLPKPAMSFACFTPGDVGELPCTEFTRDTLLTVHADEDLPVGTSLRFVRSGEPMADVELAQLKRGKEMQLPLPSQLCLHATGGRLEIRIVRAVAAAGADGEEVGEDGPYNLRC
ncbi:MAG TPA: hypothetical protein VNS11_02645 [Sphingomicrobium sp.]|nr:hypothetical protein [Sphingomicrobium sp.]